MEELTSYLHVLESCEAVSFFALYFSFINYIWPLLFLPPLLLVPSPHFLSSPHPFLLSFPRGSIIAASVSVSLYEPCLVDSVGPCFPGIPDHSGSHNPSSPSSGLCLLFGFWSLHLFPSVAEWVLWILWWCWVFEKASNWIQCPCPFWIGICRTGEMSWSSLKEFTFCSFKCLLKILVFVDHGNKALLSWTGSNTYSY